MNPKYLIPIVITAIVAAVIIYFVNDNANDVGRSSSSLTTTSSSDTDSGGSSTDDTVDAAKETADADAATNEDDIDLSIPPLLSGRVIGNGEGIAGASILLFPVREIERAIGRFEQIIPTGGQLPSIPKMVASIRKELDKFKKSAVITTSIEDGTFELRGDYEGGFIVLAYARGWLFHYGDVVSLTADYTAELTVPLEKGADISGRVVNSVGGTVSGVRVLAEYRPTGAPGIGRLVRKGLKYLNGEFLKGPFETRTDSEGNFTIPSLPPGTYDLLAYDESGIESYTPSVETGSSSNVIYFGEGSRISGILTDNYGAPLTGMPITLERVDDTISLPPIAAQFGDLANTINRYLGDPPKVIETNDDGTFEFHPLGMGNYRLSITESGFFSYKKQVSVDWHEDLNLGVVELPRGQSIRGIVRSTRGEPLGGATVFAAKTDNAMFGMGGMAADFATGRMQTKTEPDGSFEIGGLHKGTYAIMATMPEFAGANQRDVESDNEELVELELEAGGVLVGRVIDSEGEPVKDVRVRLAGANADTDSDGRFELRGVNLSGRSGGGPFMFSAEMRTRGDREGPKSSWLSANAKGYMGARISVALDPLPSEVEVQIDAAPPISGVVLDPQGEPAPGCLVRITPDFPQEMESLGYFDTSLIFLGVTTTDLEGRFTFDNYHAFPGGDNFKIIADHVLYSRGSSETFDFDEFTAGDRDVEVQLIAATSVEGVVTDGANPVPGAIVRLARPMRGGSRQQTAIMGMLGLPKGGDTATTGIDGRFLFKKLQPGDYVLSAEMVGFTESSERDLVLAAGDAQTADFVLNPGGTITGTVYDDSGAVVTGAKVRLLRDSDDEGIRQAQRMMGSGYKTMITKDDGRFSFEGLPDDTYYTLLGSAKTYSETEVDSVRVGDDTGVTLVPAADLIGFVLDTATGRPIDDFRVSIRNQNGDDPTMAMGWNMGGRRVTGTGGQFERRNLAPGEYTVSLSATGYGAQESVVMLSPGSLREATFRLGRAGVLKGRVTDNEGNPIAGARVQVTSASDGELSDEEALRRMWSSRMSGESSTTDENGDYTINSFPSGPRIVRVSHESFVPALSSNIEVEYGSDSELNVILERGLKMSGKVISSSGTTAQGSFLFCRGADDDTRHITKTIVADASGNYEIVGLTKGSYRVTQMGRRSGSEPVLVDLQEDRDDLDINIP